MQRRGLSNFYVSAMALLKWNANDEGMRAREQAVASPLGKRGWPHSFSLRCCRRAKNNSQRDPRRGAKVQNSAPRARKGNGSWKTKIACLDWHQCDPMIQTADFKRRIGRRPERQRPQCGFVIRPGCDKFCSFDCVN